MEEVCEIGGLGQLEMVDGGWPSALASNTEFYEPSLEETVSEHDMR